MLQARTLLRDRCEGTSRLLPALPARQSCQFQPAGRVLGTVGPLPSVGRDPRIVGKGNQYTDRSEPSPVPRCNTERPGIRRGKSLLIGSHSRSSHPQAMSHTYRNSSRIRRLPSVSCNTDRPCSYSGFRRLKVLPVERGMRAKENPTFLPRSKVLPGPMCAANNTAPANSAGPKPRAGCCSKVWKTPRHYTRSELRYQTVVGPANLS
jgi:hypothetical protein